MAHRACPYRVDRISEGFEIRALRKRQVDGFLYVRMYNQEVIMPSCTSGLPTVLVDGTCSDPLIPSIVPDEFSGGCTATRYLIRYGHTEIAFINNVDDIAAARGRLAGYRSSLDEMGLDYRPEYVVSETPDAVGGLRAARRVPTTQSPYGGLLLQHERWPWACTTQQTNAASEFQTMYQSSASTIKSVLAMVSFLA